MPIHLHPHLRALEEAEESAGLIVALDSGGVVAQKNLETAGLAKKVVPVAQTRIINGKVYTAS